VLTVYQCDRDGFFVGSVPADPDPLEPGRWLIPAGCVLEPPPAVEAPARARLWGGAWTVWEPPPPDPRDEPEPAPPPRPFLETYAFRRKFSLAERARITVEADLRMRRDPPDPTLRVFLEDLAAATFVYLDDPEVVGVVQYLEAEGLIAPGRHVEVLTP
jgi:hypothetical protein